MINLIILSSLYSDVGTIASPVSTVEEVLGKQRKKIQPWVTNEVLDLCDQRRQLKQQKYTNTETGLEHTQVNREVRKKMKVVTVGWIERAHGGKQPVGLQHSQGCHQHPAVQVSSHRKQQL